MRLLEHLALSLYRRRLRGATRLFSWLGIGGQHGRRVIASASSGARFELDPFDYIDSFILRQGFYESEVFDALLQAMPERGVFWDVGANFGLHAVSLQVARPDCTVLAFEPSPRELARMVRAIALNQSRVQIMPFGLSDRSGFLPFHVCQNNFGRNTFAALPDPESFVQSTAAITSADALVAAGLAPVPNVVKIDVEGFELDVLRGMRGILADPRCQAIVIETDPSAMAPNSDLRQLLPPGQFELIPLDRREATGHTLDNLLLRRVSQIERHNEAQVR